MATIPTTSGLLGLTLLLVASPPVVETPVPPTTAPSTAPDTVDLDARIERLLERLEAKRVALNVPGLAIAVVRDDKVVLSTGLGLADIREGQAATDETRFAIGSTTKAMTATLLGMLVDDGVMGWDDPVRRHLPGYHLADDDADKRVVIRDLLCHRIGLASLTMLWYGLDTSREEVLGASYEAELLYPFREKFNYSNIGFLAAGEAAAKATGEEIADRLLNAGAPA